MTRIFSVLALFALVLMAAVMILGLTLGDMSQGIPHDKIVAVRVHRLMGVAAAMTIVLVNSIAVTYFIGVSRWCKEVVETYGLDFELIRRSARLKRRTFPWAVLGMLTVVGVSALGAASDPARGQQGVDFWATYHLGAALLGFAIIAWAFFAEWSNIHANYRVVSDVLTEVKRIRLERGLEIEATGA